MAETSGRGRELARFTRPELRAINSAGPALFAVIGVVMLAVVNSRNVGSSAGGVGGTRIFGGILLALSIVWLIRVLRGACVIALEKGVLVREIVRSRWFVWSDVRSVEVTEGLINANVLSRRCALVITDKEGRHVITSFNAPSRERGEMATVARSLSELKAMT